MISGGPALLGDPVEAEGLDVGGIPLPAHECLVEHVGIIALELIGRREPVWDRVGASRSIRWAIAFAVRVPPAPETLIMLSSVDEKGMFAMLSGLIFRR